MFNKFRTLLIIAILALLATQVAADNQILAPDDGCPNNLTLLPANTEIYFAPYIQQGQVSNGFVDPNTITALHTVYMNYLQQELPVSSLLTSSPEFDVLQEAPTPIVLTGNYHCISDGITGIFREALVDGDTAWVIEKIIIEELVLTDDIIEQFTIELLEQLEMAPEDNQQLNFVPPTASNGLQAPDISPVLHNARFNFWQIYNVVSVDTPGNLATPDSLPQDVCGEYTAPSYLGVGMQAEMQGYEYVRFPLSGDLSDGSQSNWLDLDIPYFGSSYGLSFYQDMRNLPIYEVPVPDFDNIFIVATAETIFAPPVYGAPIATILSGPVCMDYEIVDNHPCPDNDVCEYNDPISDRYAIWWEIEVTIHGETYQGWYPENLTQYGWWLYENDGIFDRAATAYLLNPVSQAMTTGGEDCDPLPASRYPAGTDVQPAVGAMNIRDDASGSIIGRVEANERMTLVGEGDCEEGVRWREVIFHSGSVSRGWVAENDTTIFYIATYVPPVETVEPEPTRPADSGQPGNDNNRPQPTPQPTSASIRPAPTCVPGTGRNC